MISVYNSMQELSRLSEQDFGVKFQPSKICMVCSAQRPAHKGYKFKKV